MRRVKTIIRTSLLYLSALLLVAGYPVMAMAEAPVGTAEAPLTTQTEPAPPKPTYTYNPTTGMWDTNSWRYNASTGAYEAVPPSAVTTSTPVVEAAKQSDPPADQSQKTVDPAVSAADASATATTAQTQVTVTNAVGSAAGTGNAAVLANTAAGSATSGDATATVTILNNVNSVIATGGGQSPANFTVDVMGDVNGDIMLYPLLLKTMLGSGATSEPTASTAIVANQVNALTNNVAVQAASGNATVSGNTSAGNATTGSANAVANVMNLLNSMISAKQSFVGTINIYGNLNGDILISPDFIPQMIASNKTASSPTGTTSVQTTNTQDIVNNIALSAKSGSASVLGNTSAGNAATGLSNTNIAIFNLTGHAVVAKNSLLVFVNVLGNWVGLIVDAPAGATAALIGEGVQSDAVTLPDVSVTATTTSAITNTITLDAQSGDAVVSKNTTAGSATSGNATASANIANISNSQLGMSDWFGVLFINVFHNWFGSFGVNTSYGDAPTTGIVMPSGSSQPGVIQFVPRSPVGSATVGRVTSFGQPSYAAPASVQGEETENIPPVSAVGVTTESAIIGTGVDYRFPIMIGSIFVVAVSAAALRRLLFGDRTSAIAGIHE